MSDQENQLTPVDADSVRSLCIAQGLDEVEIKSVVTTESTNADAAQLALDDSNKTGSESDPGSDLGLQVVVAATQTGGRGRLNRQWTDQGEDSLSFSVLRAVPRSIAVDDWGWIPLLAGLAVATVAGHHGVDAKTKWPNDVVVEDPDAEAGYKKLAGILSEAVIRQMATNQDLSGQNVAGPNQVVVGMGINLTSDEADLPLPTATSFKAAGGIELTRETILAEILVEFDQLWQVWVEADGDAQAAGVAARYVSSSATIGTQVKVEGVGTTLTGTASGVDERGQLIIGQPDGSATKVSVGDVEHVR